MLVLSDYEISSSRGFLPTESPLERLPDCYYDEWEFIAMNISELITGDRLRTSIDKLQVLSTNRLHHVSEWRRAYSILTFMANGYIWSGRKPSDRLPSSVSIPLLKVSQHLGLQPATSYSAVCLWNFKPVDVNGIIRNPENLSTLLSFTGSFDESWFYLISVAIESCGAPAIPLMLDAIEAARVCDSSTVVSCLYNFTTILKELGCLLNRMYEHCDPEVFYNQIRPFLAGSKNLHTTGQSEGVIYEEIGDNGQYRTYSGGSNAQSSLIQFFDITLGIFHRPTNSSKILAGMEPEQSGFLPNLTFMEEMRDYMPEPHRRFLEDVARISNIKDYVRASEHNQDLRLAYNSCLRSLSDFRNTHINMVMRYVLLESYKEHKLQAVPQLGSSLDPGTDLRNQSSRKIDLKGTGGTDMFTFLKQVRDETICSVEDTKSALNLSTDDAFWNQPKPPVISDLDKLFRADGVKLAVKACLGAIHEWGGDVAEITHIVAVTCTNVGNPGFDLLVAQDLGLQDGIDRTLLHGVGCAGGLSVLRMAAHLADAATYRGNLAKILIVACEVCSIHVRCDLKVSKEGHENTKIAPALFSDGAAAMIVCNSLSAGKEQKGIYSVVKCTNKVLPGTSHEMELLVHPLGFSTTLSKDVPRLAANCIMSNSG